MVTGGFLLQKAILPVTYFLFVSAKITGYHYSSSRLGNLRECVAGRHVYVAGLGGVLQVDGLDARSRWQIGDILDVDRQHLALEDMDSDIHYCWSIVLPETRREPADRDDREDRAKFPSCCRRYRLDLDLVHVLHDVDPVRDDLGHDSPVEAAVRSPTLRCSRI